MANIGLRSVSSRTWEQSFGAETYTFAIQNVAHATSSTIITWEFARNTASGPPQTYWIKLGIWIGSRVINAHIKVWGVLLLTSPPSDFRYLLIPKKKKSNNHEAWDGLGPLCNRKQEGTFLRTLHCGPFVKKHQEGKKNLEVAKSDTDRDKASQGNKCGRDGSHVNRKIHASS